MLFLSLASGYCPKNYQHCFTHGLGLLTYETFKYFETMFTLEEIMTTKPTSEDESNEDLDSLLAGLKQDQLDKLATELNKSKPKRDMSLKWNDTKLKMARSRQISAEAERLYNASRKAPYNFDTFEDFTAFDDKLRADTKAQAIEMYKEKDE